MNLQKPTALLLLVSTGLLLGACGNFVADEPTEVEPAETAEASGDAQPTEWLTDYEAALALAREEGKPVLVNFTGSDWCPPCKLLKRDIFDTAAFASYAEQNLILLEIDFPMGHKQSPELVEQNEGLQERFEIESFPTLIVLDGDGEETKRSIGYIDGGPRALIRWIEK